MSVASRTGEKPRTIAPPATRGSNDDQSKIPRPKSLLKVQQAESYISVDDIKALAGAQYQSPVISLYLRFNADKVVPRGTALLRFFHSMKDRALDESGEWIETLSKPQRKQLTNDLNEIEAFLSNHSFPEGFRSEMIFKSGEELNRVITLPVRMSDNLTIDVDPYVMPLEIALEENERVLFVEISWNESRFLLYHLGYCHELGGIKPSIPVQPGDGDTTDGARRRLTHSEWHLKNTARKAYDLCRARSCQVLILMGEDRTAHFLEKYLHESLTEKIIGRIYSAPATDHRSRKELIENNLREYKTAKEVRAIEELRNCKPGDELACGLRDVVEACNLFLMRKLFAADGVPAKGFLCAEHHYLSFADQQCPFCHKKLLQVESLFDELVEVSRLHGVSVNIFEYQPNLLAEYEGVAALLYPSANLA
jgi:hypothetical protein